MARGKALVEWDLDPIPGWNDEPADMVRNLQRYVDETIGHYNPVVQEVEEIDPEAYTVRITGEMGLPGISVEVGTTTTDSLIVARMVYDGLTDAYPDYQVELEDSTHTVIDATYDLEEEISAEGYYQDQRERSGVDNP